MYGAKYELLVANKTLDAIKLEIQEYLDDGDDEEDTTRAYIQALLLEVATPLQLQMIDLCLSRIRCSRMVLMC